MGLAKTTSKPNQDLNEAEEQTVTDFCINLSQAIITDRHKNLKKETSLEKINLLPALERIGSNQRMREAMVKKHQFLLLACQALSPLPDGLLPNEKLIETFLDILEAAKLNASDVMHCEEEYEMVYGREEDLAPVDEYIQGGLGKTLLYLWRREDISTKLRNRLEVFIQRLMDSLIKEVDGNEE